MEVKEIIAEIKEKMAAKMCIRDRQGGDGPLGTGYHYLRGKTHL